MTRRTYTDWNLFREHIVQDVIDYCNMQGKSLGYWAEMPQFARDKIRATRLRNERYDLEQCKPCGDLWLCVHETLYPKHPTQNTRTQSGRMSAFILIRCTTLTQKNKTRATYCVECTADRLRTVC